MSGGTERGRWKSRTGFLLAVIGSAVGLGNIWRFPYLAYKNGGGAFLIPYGIALFTVGIPLMILELSIGHKFRASAPLAFKRIGRRWETLGWWIAVYIFMGINFYYCVVISWCLNYLRFSFGLSWGESTGSFFNETFLGLSKGPYQFGGLNWPIVFGLAIVWLINWWVVYKGVRRGIEIATKILMPFLGVTILILVAWSLTLPGAMEGVKVYLLPDFSRLSDPKIWGDAFSQIFFSASLALGAIIAYASYLPARSNIKANAVIACLANSGFSLIAGLAVFSTLGYMSFATGKPVQEVVSGGPGLAFVTYPATINLLPFGNHAFGILFFLALLFAGITSSVSLYESSASSIIDKFGWSRKKVTTVMVFIGFAGGLVFASGAGLYWLDLVDFVINHFCLLVVGLLEAVAVGWVYRTHKIKTHIRSAVSSSPGEEIIEGKSGSLLGKIWEYSIIIWIPLILGVLLILEIFSLIKEPYSGYSWIFIIPVGLGWIVMTLTIAWFLSRAGWRNPPAKEEGM